MEYPFEYFLYIMFWCSDISNREWTKYYDQYNCPELCDRYRYNTNKNNRKWLLSECEWHVIRPYGRKLLQTSINDNYRVKNDNLNAWSYR
eukprot:UN08036